MKYSVILLPILAIAVNAKPQDSASVKRSGGTGAGCPDCEGCEQMRLDQVPDLNSFKFPSVAETPGTAAGATRNLKSTFKKFVALGIGISHLLPQPYAGFIRAGNGIFTSVLSMSVKGTGSGIWEKIERKVEGVIFQYETYDHFKDLESYWHELHYITTRCPTDITRDDLKDIVKMKESMFPQNNDNVNFTPNWITVLNGYMMYMAAVYLELMRQNKLPECALAEEWSEMREDIVNALKSLQMKRYHKISGHDYENGAGGHYKYAKLQYKDDLRGDLWPESLYDDDAVDIQQTKTVYLRAIKDDTAKMIDPLRLRFNNLTDVISDVIEGCPTKTAKIPWEASYLDWPSSCYGTPDDPDDSPCLLPCGLYDYSSNWCPNDYALHTFSEAPPGNNAGKVVGGNNNAECTPATHLSKWKKCYPIKEAGRARFFNAPWQHGIFKKNKKSKKQKKEKKVGKEKDNMLEKQEAENVNNMEAE